MIKIFFSIFFSLSFLFTSIVPTIDMLSDRFDDFAELYDKNGEEEKKYEAEIEKDLFMHDSIQDNYNYKIVLNNLLLDSGQLHYLRPHLNLVLPPPEFRTS